MSPTTDRLREQMEVYVEAAIALRDILEFVEDPDGPKAPLVPRSAAEVLRQIANRIERKQETRRRTVAILEQLGLWP